MEVAVVLDDLPCGPVPTALVVVTGPVFQEFDVGLQVGGVVGVDGMVADQLDEEVAPGAGDADVLVLSPWPTSWRRDTRRTPRLKSGLSEGGRATVRLSSL